MLYHQKRDPKHWAHYFFSPRREIAPSKTEPGEMEANKDFVMSKEAQLLLLQSILITSIIKLTRTEKLQWLTFPMHFFKLTMKEKEWSWRSRGNFHLSWLKHALNCVNPFDSQERSSNTLCWNQKDNSWNVAQQPAISQQACQRSHWPRIYNWPYDPCVANKTVNRKQLTITWHVDNLIVYANWRKQWMICPMDPKQL